MFLMRVMDINFSNTGLYTIVFVKDTIDGFAQSLYDTLWYDTSGEPIVVSTEGADYEHPIVAILDTGFRCNQLLRFKDINITSRSILSSNNETRLIDSCTAIFDYGVVSGNPPAWLNGAQECYDLNFDPQFGSPQLFSHVRLPPYVYPRTPEQRAQDTACGTTTVKPGAMYACCCAHWQATTLTGQPVFVDSCTPQFTVINTGPTVLDTAIVFLLRDNAYPGIVYRRDTLHLRVYPQPQLHLLATEPVRCEPTASGSVLTGLTNATPPVQLLANDAPPQPYAPLLPGLLPGPYQLVVQDAHQCTDTLRTEVPYYPAVPLAWNLNPPPPGPLYLSQRIEAQLLTDTTRLQQWAWATTDTLPPSGLTQLQLTPRQPGPWHLQLTGLDTSQCADTLAAHYTVERIWLQLPTAFAPGTPGPNATWPGNLPLGLRQANLAVYNRWGHRVWYSNVVGSLGWNGLSDDTQTLVPEGVYVWHLQAVTLAGQPAELSGTVTVLR
jgi:hypothetical protein